MDNEFKSDLAGLAADIEELRALKVELADRTLDIIRFDIIASACDIRESIKDFHARVGELRRPAPVDSDTAPIYGVGYRGGRYAA